MKLFKRISTFLLAIMCMFVIAGMGTKVKAATETWDLSSGELKIAGGEITKGDLKWIYPSFTYLGYAAEKGAQIGSNKKPTTAFSLTTSDVTDTVTSIKVNSSIASSGTAQMTITIGGETVAKDVALTTDATDYSYDNLNLSGEIVISWANTAKAFYIKSIEITWKNDAIYKAELHYNNTAENSIINTDIETGLLARPTDPTKAGYVFDDWYTEPEFINKFDFDTVLESNIDLYARYVSTTQVNLNGVESFMRIAYTYTNTNSTGYTAEQTTKLEADVTNGTIPETSDNIASMFSGANDLDIYCSKNGSTNFLYLKKGNASPIRLYKDATNGNGSSLTISVKGGGIVTDCTVDGTYCISIDNGDGTYTVQCNDKDNQSSIQSITVKYKKETIIYSDVDFRLAFAIQKTVKDIDGATEYGIAVKVGDKVAMYTGSKLHDALDDDDNDTLYQTVVDLGDVLTDMTLSEKVFIVSAYVVVDGTKYYSETTKEFSVATLIKEYYENLSVSEVEDLYNIYAAKGLYE